MPTDYEEKHGDELPNLMSLGEVAWKAIDQIQRRGSKPEIETGLHVLDENASGLHRKRLLTIGARPGVGKTTLACQIALNVAKNGFKVVFVSLEMFAEGIVEKMMCVDKGVDANELRKGVEGKAEIRRKLHEFGGEVQETPLKIVDDFCYKPEQLSVLFEELGCDPDVIIVDHLQHTRTDMRKSAHEALNDYLDEILRISRKNDVALVLLSQINRDGDNAPTTAHLKGSGAIEEKSDYILLLHDPQEEDEHGNNFIFNLAKNRFGPSFKKYKSYFDKDHSRFFDSHREYVRSQQELVI